MGKEDLAIEKLVEASGQDGDLGRQAHLCA